MIDDYWDAYDADSIAEFHAKWMKLHRSDEVWEELTDEKKLSFAIEVIDGFLTGVGQERPVIDGAWHIVFDATKHIYPPVPQG
jgi:hypothetical protein